MALEDPGPRIDIQVPFIGVLRGVAAEGTPVYPFVSGAFLREPEAEPLSDSDNVEVLQADHPLEKLQGDARKAPPLAFWTVQGAD
ncbi:hypothetical protein [Desulfofundulus sp.]|uniref:hypothetical protein n=1 Tax=Desulfofundulus sp. TaxID=2282750 RepID=UPI003C774799